MSESLLTIEETAQVLKNPITGAPVCLRTIRNYINAGILDAERKLNEATGRVVWRVKEASIATVSQRIEKRDAEMRKQYAERLRLNKEIGRKRDEEDPKRKEKRSAAIRKKRLKAKPTDKNS
jgi:hypothetical protein